MRSYVGQSLTYRCRKYALYFTKRPVSTSKRLFFEKNGDNPHAFFFSPYSSPIRKRRAACLPPLLYHCHTDSGWRTPSQTFIIVTRMRDGERHPKHLSLSHGFEMANAIPNLLIWAKKEGGKIPPLCMKLLCDLYFRFPRLPWGWNRRGHHLEIQNQQRRFHHQPP